MFYFIFFYIYFLSCFSFGGYKLISGLNVDLNASVMCGIICLSMPFSFVMAKYIENLEGEEND